MVHPFAAVRAGANLAVLDNLSVDLWPENAMHLAYDRAETEESTR
jgi:hypothetical protein